MLEWFVGVAVVIVVTAVATCAVLKAWRNAQVLKLKRQLEEARDNAACWKRSYEEDARHCQEVTRARSIKPFLQCLVEIEEIMRGVKESERVSDE